MAIGENDKKKKTNNGLTQATQKRQSLGKTTQRKQARAGSQSTQEGDSSAVFRGTRDYTRDPYLNPENRAGLEEMARKMQSGATSPGPAVSPRSGTERIGRGLAAAVPGGAALNAAQEIYQAASVPQDYGDITRPPSSIAGELFQYNPSREAPTIGQEQAYVPVPEPRRTQQGTAEQALRPGGGFTVIPAFQSPTTTETPTTAGTTPQQRRGLNEAEQYAYSLQHGDVFSSGGVGEFYRNLSSQRNAIRTALLRKQISPRRAAEAMAALNDQELAARGRLGEIQGGTTQRIAAEAQQQAAGARGLGAQVDALKHTTLSANKQAQLQADYAKMSEDRKQSLLDLAAETQLTVPQIMEAINKQAQQTGQVVSIEEMARQLGATPFLFRGNVPQMERATRQRLAQAPEPGRQVYAADQRRNREENQ